MHELLISMVIASLTVAILAAIWILVELAIPRSREVSLSRFPGFLFLILNPALVVVLSEPLGEIWQVIRIPPLVSLAGFSNTQRFAILLVIYDFLRYLEHRVEHTIWWAVHSLHHSQTELHVANSYSHPLIGVTEFFVILIPLSLVDRHGSALWVTYGLGAAMAFQNIWIHAPIRLHLGPVRRIFVDNHYHRIHHSTEEKHFNKNFAIMFSVWDQLFGTAYFPASEEWPNTGVAGIPPPTGALEYLLHPFRHFKHPGIRRLVRVLQK